MAFSLKKNSRLFGSVGRGVVLLENFMQIQKIWGKIFHNLNKQLASTLFLLKQSFLFSAHISYGKGKYLNQTGFFFFYKICQDFICI